MANELSYNFDTLNDRFSTPSAKFKSAYLLELFGTEDLYPFWIADQDFRTSPSIIDGLEKKAKSGLFGYECFPENYKSHIVAWFQNQYGCSIQPESIFFTPTIMTSMAMALDSFTSENAQVIIQPPVYKEFKSVLNRTDKKPIVNPLKLVDLRYEMDFHHLRKIVAQSTAEAILICNPHNPGGRVWSHKELKELVTICLNKDILIISDEIHADIVFSKYTFTSLLAFPEIHAQLVVLYSPSKAFNLASITDSICIIPNPKLHEKFKTLQNRYNLGRPNAFAQVANSIAFEKGDVWVKGLNEYIEANHHFISKFIENKLPQLALIKQEGTYLVWIDVSKLSLKGSKLIQYLAKEAKIGLSDGILFGAEGEGFVRMNISCPLKVIEHAMENLERAIQSIESIKTTR